MKSCEDLLSDAELFSFFFSLLFLELRLVETLIVLYLIWLEISVLIVIFKVLKLLFIIILNVTTTLKSHNRGQSLSLSRWYIFFLWYLIYGEGILRGFFLEALFAFHFLDFYLLFFGCRTWLCVCIWKWDNIIFRSHIIVMNNIWTAYWFRWLIVRIDF